MTIPPENPSNFTQSRREFLRRLAIRGLAAGGIELTDLAGFSAPHAPLRIIIVGAGMAGLCAAYELEKRGHSVTVLEAEPSHIGGRVRTMRFAGGQYGEIGAMRIPGNHHLTRKYIREFGLALRPFVQYNPNGYYYAHGIRRRIHDVTQMDHQVTLGMDGRAVSEWSQPFDEIVGGMDTLAAAFAERLKSKPCSGYIVTRIVQDKANRRASVFYIRNEVPSPGGAQVGRSTSTSITGDFVLCTVPVPVLKRLPVEPALSAVKVRAMAELPYNAANKVLAETAHRFWESDDRIFGGATYTDLPTEFAYYPSDNAKRKDPRVSAGPGVLLASYTIGQRAIPYASESPGSAATDTIRTLSAVHPQLSKPGMVLKAVDWSWDAHPWSRGGFAAPGKRMDLRAVLSAPEGRLLFAGEHLSQHRTWIQGALESALVAVRQMLES